MTIDVNIAKAKALIAERERIDAGLRELFGLDETANTASAPRRGRPRKDTATAAAETAEKAADAPQASGGSV